MLADAVRHLKQNAMNLGLLVLQQPHQFVVLLDGLQRLDEHRLPAGAGAVDHALHAAFLLGFTGMTKRSPRMVMSSSCTAPPSASRRR